MLRGAGLTAGPGECVLLLGPNGSGKSTLLKAAAGVLPFSGGKITVCGHDTIEDPESARRRTGYLGHLPGLYDELTVRENLDFFGTLAGLQEEAMGRSVRRLLARLAMTDRAGAAFGSLSRGLKQRAGIARVLLHRPGVLLLDEPFTGLDRDGTGRFVALLRDELRRGAAVLVTTHELHAVEGLATAVVVMREGRPGPLLTGGPLQPGEIETALGKLEAR